MYAIRRHRAAKNAWCWRVRFSRRGVMYAKTFYDLACGGAKEAKAQAVVWRDERLANIPALTLVAFHAQRRSNNLSGVPGVHFLKSAAQPLGFWQAKIKVSGGKSTTRSLSVRQYGNREAYHLAVAARSELLANVENRLFLHHAVAKRLSKKR
jgi:hypothetical protein